VGQIITLRLGDTFQVVLTLEDVGAVVCDPPYLISFMGKDWDATAEGNQEWFARWLKLCFNLLPPGGIIKVFSATRTFHRLAAAMGGVGYADINLEAWGYGSGFPKSLNVSTAVDKHFGKLEEREVVGENPSSRPDSKKKSGRGFDTHLGEEGAGVQLITAPATEEAQRFDGWGTALKPAWEPFIVGRRP